MGVEICCGLTGEHLQVSGRTVVSLPMRDELDYIAPREELWPCCEDWSDFGDRLPVDGDRDSGAVRHLTQNLRKVVPQIARGDGGHARERSTVATGQSLGK